MSAIAVTAAATMIALSLPTAAIAVKISGDGAPQPSQTSAVVNVKVGGVRTATGAGNIDALAGVTLGLFRGTTQVQTCQSNANGYCSFVVTGSNLDKSYTIKQLASVAGSDAELHYYQNPSLSTSLSTTGFASTTYQITTPTIQANHSYTSGSGGFMTDSGGSVTASGGIWQNSYDNPTVPSVCGLSTAILVDLSSSVAVGTYLDDLKKAAKAIVDALAGTPSAVALYSFGTSATLRQSSLPTSSAANVTTLKSAIDALTISGSQYTNWDAGLYQMAGKGYDQVLVITDGNPTAYGSTTPSSVRTRFLETEQAIFSANVLKSEKTRIVAVGVGDGVSGPGDNLRAISGPVKGTDYYQTSTYTEATTALKAVSLAGCTGTVSVVKNVVPYTSPAGSIEGATPTSGWAFTHSSDANGTATPAPSSEITDENGAVNYAIEFAEGHSTAAITITETQQPGYTIVPQSTFNAVCTNNSTGDDVPVVNAPDGAPGFTVLASKLDAISCAVYNRAPTPGSSIVVDKKWIVNGGSPIANGGQPEGLSGQLTLGGADQGWGLEKTGYALGSTVAIGESTTDTNALCRITDSQITAPAEHDLGYVATLAAGLNSFTITNYVTCDAELTLVKSVVNTHGGTADADDWTLVATPASGSPIAVTTGTTTTVPAGVTYGLSEIDGPAGYELTSLVCSIDGGSPAPATSVILAAEQHATCTFTNRDIAPELKLTKVVSPSGATSAANWTLTGTGADSATVSGNGGTDYVAVKAGVPYSLTETPVDGFGSAEEFTSGSWVCTPAGGTSYTLSGGALPALAPGARVECVVTNTLKGIVPGITKTAGTPVANADGTWTISYDIAVTNPSTVAAIQYDLRDTPAFGGDISFVAVSASGPGGAIDGWTGTAPGDVLATGASLAAGTTAHYTVTVRATVARGAFAAEHPTTACLTGVDPAAGGFLNRAVLSSGGVDYPATDCAAPVEPVYAKTAGTATSNPDGTWTVPYTLTVTNPSKSTALSYDLDDTLALAPGVVVDSAVVTAPDGVTTSSEFPGRPLIATGIPLAADTTHTYVVTLTVTVPASVDPVSLECVGHTPGLGLFNSAVVESGNQEFADDACASVEPPEIVHAKTVTSTSQQSDGTWRIDYDVAVTNTSDSVAGVYDLSDVPALGDGITMSSAASATGPTAEAADWNGVGATVLAEGQAIAAGETQHFAITIHARVAAGVTGTSAADCTLDDSETGTGFLNRAILTASGASATKSDCSQPVSPSFTKELDGALLPGLDDNEYVVSYTLTAKNDTALDLYYDLSDTLGFASGVIVTSASVTGPDGLVAGWDGSATTLITSGRPLAAGHTEVWTVTVGLLVTAQVDEADLACSPTEGAGHGLFNGAVLSSGSDRFPDSACAPVLPQLPTLPFDPPTLAYTGAQPSGWLLAGLALLGGGLLLFAFRTRRTGRHVA